MRLSRNVFCAPFGLTFIESVLRSIPTRGAIETWALDKLLFLPSHRFFRIPPAYGRVSSVSPTLLLRWYWRMNAARTEGTEEGSRRVTTPPSFLSFRAN